MSIYLAKYSDTSLCGTNTCEMWLEFLSTTNTTGTPAYSVLFIDAGFSGR